MNFHDPDRMHFASTTPPAPDAPLAEWAQYYAQNRWSVFPCKGKKPLVHRGFHAATTDPFQIAIWWREWPDANIGHPMGDGAYVLDVDPRAGGDDTLRDLERQHGELPRTLTCHTGGGGLHKYLREPEGAVVINKADIGGGIDVQGKGSYVILPPSVHPDTGRRYDWDLDNGPDDIAPQRGPAWLEALVTAQTAPNGQAQGRTSVEGAIPQGRRERTLMKIAGGMRADGATVEEIRAFLEAINQRCEPPLPAVDLDRLARSTGRYDPDPAMWPARAAPSTGQAAPQDAPSAPEWGSASPASDIPPPQQTTHEEGILTCTWESGVTIRAHLARPRPRREVPRGSALQRREGQRHGGSRGPERP